MRILILTSSTKGTAAHAVPLLFKEKNIEIGMIIFNHGNINNKKKHYFKKIKKVFKIGIPGALNGIKMRKWFNEEADAYMDQADLEVFCKANNIRFEHTPSINSDLTKKLFNEANAALGISLGNSYISKPVFSICPLGMINIHGEILPEYQNAQSVIWQLYNGSFETGFTIHNINKDIDRGNILYQEKFPIIFRTTLADTVSFNCAEITKKACMALVNIIKNFQLYNSNAKPQGKGTQYTTPTWKQFNRIKKQYLILKKPQAS